MIKVLTFKSLCDEIKQAVPEIKYSLIAAHEDHAVSKLKDKAGVILLSIIPSVDRNGTQNGGYDENVTWFFILEKARIDLTDLEELQMYERLLAIIIKVRTYIEEKFGDGDKRLTRYRPSSLKISPEYNEFGGFSGWSMAIVF